MSICLFPGFKGCVGGFDSQVDVLLIGDGSFADGLFSGRIDDIESFLAVG